MDCEAAHYPLLRLVALDEIDGERLTGFRGGRATEPHPHRQLTVTANRERDRCHRAGIERHLDCMLEVPGCENRGMDSSPGCDLVCVRPATIEGRRLDPHEHPRRAGVLTIGSTISRRSVGGESGARSVEQRRLEPFSAPRPHDLERHGAVSREDDAIEHERNDDRCVSDEVDDGEVLLGEI